MGTSSHLMRTSSLSISTTSTENLRRANDGQRTEGEGAFNGAVLGKSLKIKALCSLRGRESNSQPTD